MDAVLLALLVLNAILVVANLVMLSITESGWNVAGALASAVGASAAVWGLAT